MLSPRWLPPLRSESDDLRNLDLLRLIAASGVMLQHFSGYLPESGSGERHLWFLSLFVDLFFTISGFVICFVYAGRVSNWDDYFSFLRRRIARLVPLHWATLGFFSMIGIVVLLGVHVEAPEKYDFSCFAENLFMLHSTGLCNHLSFNYASWSISAEMLIYIIFPVLCLALLRRPVLGLLIAGTVILLICRFSPAPSDDPERFWVTFTANWGAARAFPSFLIGIALFALRPHLARIPAPQVWMYLALAAFFALGLTGVRPILLLPLVYLIATGAIAADLQGRVNGFASRLCAGGQLTYSIYMLHPVVGLALLSFIGRKVLHLGIKGEIALALAAAVVVFVVSYISFVWFETPMRRWIGRRRPSDAVVAVPFTIEPVPSRL